VQDGIYQNADGSIHCHATLTTEQQAQFEQITAQWQAQAPKDERIQSLWEQANTAALAAFDHNSRLWALNQKLAGNCPAWRLERIAAIEAWLDGVWQHYYTAKYQVQAGNLGAELPALGDCPYKFADLLAE
jgi:hypothetical protein